MSTPTRLDAAAEVAALDEQIAIMERYLTMKRTVRDWHGVADAAMDIRELEAKRAVWAAVAAAAVAAAAGASA